jgi:hypothetical protein
VTDARQFTALQMLASSIDVSGNIPRRVFAPEFNDVFVMDFAWLIDRGAVDLMKMLIRVAGPPELPVLAVGSTGRRNTSLKSFCWRLVV